ncbi:MAG: hypothetical protein U5K37_05280 [Natrialbaceae archaeon]|nr:hypothetical protein [Natrialbaceae archaeon]
MVPWDAASTADKQQPVGSVFAIEDQGGLSSPSKVPRNCVDCNSWYLRQTLTDPDRVIEYPPTIKASDSSPAQGVTLACLTFFGEFIAMDFLREAVSLL